VTIRLRGHHLLCMLTYVGKGYTPAFTVNFNAIAARLSGGEEILLVDGPDDVCAPLLAEPGAHCRGEGAARRDREALAAAGQVLERFLLQRDRPLRSGARLSLAPAALRGLRSSFAGAEPVEQGFRRACVGCEWARLCSAVADGGYDGALVRMP
jgi:hypothetical protein